MTSDDTRMEKLLAELPPAEPDAARSARVRAHCLHILSKSSSAGTTTPHRPRRTVRLVASAMAGGFCLVYLFAIAAFALRFRGHL